MHLSDSSTPGANFFLLFALGQLHILVFYITGDYKEIQEQKRLEEEQQKRLDELDEEESRFGFGEYERENEYGYKDLGFFDKGS